MKFGIREITNVMMKAKSAMRLGNKVFYKDEPVLYFDSLKTSSLEGASTTVYAQGGAGNSRLVAWEGERTLTFNMEDALLSPESFAILSGAGLIENEKIENKGNITKTIIDGLREVDEYISVQEDGYKMYGPDEEMGTFYLFAQLTDYQLPINTLFSSLKVEFLNNKREKLLQYLEKLKDNDDRTLSYINYLSDDANWAEYQSFLQQIIYDDNVLKIFVYDSTGKYIMFSGDDGSATKNNIKLPATGYIKVGLGWGGTSDSQQTTVSSWMAHEDEWPYIIPEISYEIDESELITGYEHIIEKVEIVATTRTQRSTKIKKPPIGRIYFSNPKNFLQNGYYDASTDDTNLFWNVTIYGHRPTWVGLAIADYYTPIYNKTVKQLTIDPDKFGSNFYLEADTLFRDTFGADHAATFIIPNCKVQSNFTMNMASSGDPSTFNFVLDAFPGYTRFDSKKKVLAALQINEKSIHEDELLIDDSNAAWVPGGM